MTYHSPGKQSADKHSADRHGLDGHGLDLAMIGNGRTAALVNPRARIVWWCFPRYDGDPVFCRLLAGEEEKGFADVVLDDMVDYKSEYLRNTAIVCTTLPIGAAALFASPISLHVSATTSASSGRRSSSASSSRSPASRASPFGAAHP